MSDLKEYSDLRRRLVWLFQRRRALDAEDLASETIFRVLQNVSEGVCIQSLDAYAGRVARNVWLEDRRRRSRETSIGESLRTLRVPELKSKEREHACLERCLRTVLTRKEAKLIDAYYGGPLGEIACRREQLARKLGISENALRLRAFQIRRKLLDCMKRCLEDDPTK